MDEIALKCERDGACPVGGSYISYNPFQVSPLSCIQLREM